MPDLANLDQALTLIWEQVVQEWGTTAPRKIDVAVLQAMRRAYALAERKEELARTFPRA
jgi:hypothetical protein